MHRREHASLFKADLVVPLLVEDWKRKHRLGDLQQYMPPSKVDAIQLCGKKQGRRWQVTATA